MDKQHVERCAEAENKIRSLSKEEAEWINRYNTNISGLCAAIGSLAGMAFSMNEVLQDDKDLDSYIKNKIYQKGITSALFGIEKLSDMLSEQQHKIHLVLDGTTSVEMKARRAFLGR